MWLDTLGWTATGIFSSSYFFKQAAALRKIQAGAALLWVVYGLAIGSAPVVVANLIVGFAAVYTSCRSALDKRTAGAEIPIVTVPSDDATIGATGGDGDSRAAAPGL
jgi:hypothetical protein